MKAIIQAEKKPSKNIINFLHFSKEKRAYPLLGSFTQKRNTHNTFYIRNIKLQNFTIWALFSIKVFKHFRMQLFLWCSTSSFFWLSQMEGNKNGIFSKENKEKIYLPSCLSQDIKYSFIMKGFFSPSFSLHMHKGLPES